MDYALTADQASLVDAADKLSAPYRTPPTGSDVTLLRDPRFDAELDTSGFRDVARFEGMGPLDAVLVAERVLAVPYAAEFAASAIVLPALGIEAVGQVALLAGTGDAPTRFLVDGGAALIASGEDVRVISLGDGEVSPITSAYAYPIGRLATRVRDGGTVFPGLAATMIQWWHVTLAVEIAAAAGAAVEMTVDYVKERRQFGRPIGSYQAIQHRLAECTTLVHAIRMLARRAASLGTRESALAAVTLAKEACPRLIYDTHQFHGATGLTYEHPLHFFTYRLRLLQGELAAVTVTADMLSATRWDGEPPTWDD